MKPDLILCDCYSPEHQILILKDDSFGEDYKEVIFQYHLVTHRNIFRRIWVALKYIFGYKCKYGAWDETIITKDNYQPLKEVIEFLEK